MALVMLQSQICHKHFKACISAKGQSAFEGLWIAGSTGITPPSAQPAPWSASWTPLVQASEELERMIADGKTEIFSSVFTEQQSAVTFKDHTVCWCSLITEDINHHLLGISIIQSCLFKYLHSLFEEVSGSITVVLKKLWYSREAHERASACVCHAWAGPD